MLAIITIIDAVLGATSAAAILIKAVVDLFSSPEAGVLADAAKRIVAAAEQMFGSSAVPQSLGAAVIADPVAVANARNQAKWAFALRSLMCDIPGTSENDAGLAILAAVKAMKLAGAECRS